MMKRSKLLMMVAVLVSAFTFSSCLDDSNSTSYPSYERIVTVGTGGLLLHSDNGEKLIPMNTVTGLDKVERAIVAFNLYPEELNGTTLESGKTYEVTLDANYCYNVPTKKVINLSNNAEAQDSLINSQDPIVNVEGMYVKNGYLTAYISYSFSNNSQYYLDVAYDPETDVDLSTNTLTLTLYYDNKADYGQYSMRFPFSFRLPTELYNRFAEASDEINVVLRYSKEIISDESEATCKMSKTDLRPIYY